MLSSMIAAWRVGIVAALSVGAALPARAEVIYDGVVSGSIVTSSTYACNPPALTCAPCVGSSATLGPGILMGATGLNGVSACGEVSGTFSASVVLDGIQVVSGLLPTGSFFRSKFLVQHQFCPLSATHPCFGCSCGAQIVIGGLQYNNFVIGAPVVVDIPTSGATGGAFSFKFCNHQIVWGTACGFGGSLDYRWVLHAPAQVRAASLAAGDTPPTSFPGTDLTVDKNSGPGGVITVSHLVNASVNAVGPIVPDYPGYWEVRTDVPSGSLEAGIQLRFDPQLLPNSVNERDLAVWGKDLATGECFPVLTTVDEVTHTAVGSGVTRFGAFFLSSVVPPTVLRRDSWGGLKAMYR